LQQENTLFKNQFFGRVENDQNFLKILLNSSGYILSEPKIKMAEIAFSLGRTYLKIQIF